MAGLSLSTAMVAALVPLAAFGQTAKEGGTVSSEGDIIVTARRAEERLQDVPISITVFNQAQIDQRNISVASDLATFTPSLSANTRFGAERSSFAIRGFTQDGGTSPSVGVYFADVVGLRVAGASTSGNGAGVGSFFDLQNVQVLKGPQGTLFGRNTTGGAILLVPQKPTDRFEGYVEGSLGNHNLRRLQAVLNVPVSDTIRARFGIDRNKREGYLRNHSGIGPEDFNDINYTAVRGSVTIDLSPDLENYFVGTYSNSDTHGPAMGVYSCIRNPLQRSSSALLIADAGCAQVDRQAARGDGLYDIENSLPNARQHIRQWQLINTTTWRTSDTLTVKNILSFGKFTEDTTQTVFGDNLKIPAVLNLVNSGFVIPVPTGSLAGTPYTFAYSSPVPGGHLNNQTTLTEELQFQGVSLDQKLNWQAGIYYETSNPVGFSGSAPPTLASCIDATQFQCSDVLALFTRRSVGFIGLRTQKNRFRNFGVYGQATYKITDQFSITGGLRYTNDYNKLVQRGLTYGLTVPPAAPGIVPATSFCTNLVAFNPKKITTNPADCETTYVAKSERPTWMIDLDYKPTEDTLLYAKYARGYRQGAANPLAATLVVFGPEKVDAYEIGAKISFGGVLHGYLNLAGFYNDFTNQQLQVGALTRPGTASPGALIVNAGKSRIKGIELDASIEPVSGLRIEGGYTYLDTKLISFSPPDVSTNPIVSTLLPTIVVGKPLTQTPKNKFYVTGTYTLPLDESIGAVSVSATLNHTDSFQSTYINPLAVIPSVNLVNASFNWRNIAGSPLDLTVFATNLTKKKYPSFISGTLPITGYETRGIAEPRMWGVRLKVRFGE